MHDIVHRIINNAVSQSPFFKRVAEVKRLRLEDRERAVAAAEAKRARRRQRNLGVAANAG